MSHHEHRPGHTDAATTEMFEPSAWDERYSGDAKVWSGEPNPQLVAEASRLTPGTALDVGCGEGGDVIWLAQRGWRVTGADFSAAGLARAARNAEAAGVADRTDWWQVDARTFAAGGRSYDIVTTHFLHPPDGGMVDVARRLASAVALGGHLLVVGHAPSEAFSHLAASQHNAMFHHDPVRARESLAEVRTSSSGVVLPGHGEAWIGPVDEAVDAALSAGSAW